MMNQSVEGLRQDLYELRRQFRRYVAMGNAGGILSIATVAGPYLNDDSFQDVRLLLAKGLISCMGGLFTMGIALGADWARCYFESREEEGRDGVYGSAFFINFSIRARVLNPSVCRWTEGISIALGSCCLLLGTMYSVRGFLEMTSN